MTQERPNFGNPIPRTNLYGEPHEPYPESSRVMMVVGDGMQSRREFPTMRKSFNFGDGREFLTPESERIARIAATRVLKNVEHRVRMESLGYGLKSPIRDILRDELQPLVPRSRIAIGDTVIILGPHSGYANPAESYALFAGMLGAVPDLAKLRGVDVHLEDNDRPSIYSSMEFAKRVIDTDILGRGSDVESVTLVCPRRQNEILSKTAQRSGIRIDFVHNL